MVIENGKFKHICIVEGEVELDITKAIRFEDCLSVNGFSFAVVDYPELASAWQTLYPNGKPLPELPNTPRTPTEIEQLWELVGFALGVPTRNPEEIPQPQPPK